MSFYNTIDHASYENTKAAGKGIATGARTLYISLNPVSRMVMFNRPAIIPSSGGAVPG